MKIYRNKKRWFDLFEAETRSEGYNKYLDYINVSKHINKNALSVFKTWISTQKEKISIDDVKDAAEKIFKDRMSKNKVIIYARTKGVKEKN